MADTSEELGPRWQSERCPECAFDPNGVSAADLPAAVAGLGRRYQAPLTRFLPGEDESILVARPQPGQWSALAYACHVRDVLTVFEGRILRMLDEDGPVFAVWDQDAAVEADGYEKQAPAEVAAAVAANAARLSATLAAVPDGGWDRTGSRRDGAVFTVLGAGRYALHEGTHHLLDIGRVLRAARGR
ncbi:MAG TPA: DinB family protein [Acidimicrobiia bacterium]|nr:DinB family protein [Acidimicrobiia bacterium]